MSILAIDSSLGTAVAIIDEAGETLSEIVSLDPLAHVEVVGTSIQRALLMAGMAAKELSAVAVGVGPGPFTGLRVGIAAAKGFAFGAGVPLRGVSSLDALALQLYRGDYSAFRAVQAGEFSGPRRAQQLTPASGILQRPMPTETVHLVTDARRREVFSARYAGLDPNGLPLRIGEPGLLAGAEVPEEAITADWLSAASVAQLAQLQMRLGQSGEVPTAVYLRAPDVTLSAPKRVS